MVTHYKNWISDEALHDADLLRAIAAGDRASFSEFYDRSSSLIFSAVFRVLQNQQDAEDVTQEVFSQIWRKADLYESSKGKALTWATTMARNRAIDHLRSKHRRARLREQVGGELIGDDLELVTTDSAFANERSRIVRSAVTCLARPQREAIELAYFSGLSQREIAERLGEPLGTIKARIRRGVTKLHGTVSRKL